MATQQQIIPSQHFVSITVRPAFEGDVPAITEIYNQGIEDRIATLEGEPHPVEERLAWFRDHGPTEPILVAEVDGMVVGWASLSRYKPRRCYDGVKELSIYVRREWRGKGVGSLLLDALLKRAAQVGVHKVVLYAFPSNTRALRLYRKMGFRTVGIYKHHGMLDGQWRDIIAMELDVAGDQE
ncbi:MAG: arsinothricin resistance N-acetyltransferase ArsN1 [Dehalococcoidia bacterium]|nr:arsinothricin resistance N-acetyltransferase ArsN1 [Dehalococcoidia bacterium]MDW8119392.1 arsinothricin resistance N-acetyltransferase ArsN1 [Chloroflexota bacterium]